MRPEARSLRNQLLRWLLLPVLLLLALDGAIAYGLALKYANTAYDRALFDTTLTLAGQVRVQDGAVRVELPPMAMRMLTIDQYDRIYYRVDDIDAGRLLIGSTALPPAPALPAADGASLLRDASINGEPVRISALRLDFGARRILVQSAETLIKRQMLARQILWGILLPQLLLIALAAGVIWFGIHNGLAPLRRLEAVLASRSANDLQSLDSSAIPVETRGLIVALNGLLQRTASMVAAQHRFIANAAHQLRTPFAGIKAQLALARRSSDPQQVAQSLLQLQHAADHGVRLTQQLLLLAQVDPENTLQQPAVMLDLNRLAADVVAEWVPASLQRQQDLGLQPAPQPARVLGSPLLLRELLANLIDNALRYTQQGGVITVALWQTAASVWLQVEDNGRGIAPAERTRVLERFYRSPDNTEPGCGLGLAIVSEIAGRHGASVSIDAAGSGSGTCVTVCFTAAGEESLQFATEAASEGKPKKVL